MILGASPQGRNPSKNWRMLLFAARTRYSLVKGERIVRSVLTAQLRELLRKSNPFFILDLFHYSVTVLHCGTAIKVSKVQTKPK